jgi:hypothetical protein
MFLALNLRVHTSKGELVPVIMLKFLTWATEIKPSRMLKFSNFPENMAVAIFMLDISEEGGVGNSSNVDILDDPKIFSLKILTTVYAETLGNLQTFMRPITESRT